jgi:hypothetical protein
MMAAGMRMDQNPAKQQGAAEAMAAAPIRDITAGLQKLADLHKSAALTDEESAAARNILLGYHCYSRILF